jgi:cytochrome c2
MARLGWLVTAGVTALLLASCGSGPRPGEVLDEAKLAGRDAASFPHADEDYFHDMDNAVALTSDEVKGRNMWIVWTGGNDRQWDKLGPAGFGTLDLLKIVTSHPSQRVRYGDVKDAPYNRETRWEWLGGVNEPCFATATGPDPDRFGLWLDVRRKDCPADPFEKEEKYPGVKIGARGQPIGDGKTLPVGSYYGTATGIVGLRLFPNPDFDEKAAKAWDPERFYTDPSYYNRPDLVRPYRVGMSCGFCHVGPSPIHPPADPSNPGWSNLSSSVGAQYLWSDRLFSYKAERDNFIYQLLKTYRPGALDTSLVSTDYIVNPRTMNAIYLLGPRLDLAWRWGKETLAGGELDNKQFNDYVSPNDPLAELYVKPNVWTPRVLKDGSDSIGALGALNRVYLNIGLFSEEWLLHFRAFAGGRPISPIKIADAQKNSTYWRATEEGTMAMAAFFLKAGQPDLLRQAPGGKKHLSTDAATLARGKQVFAETCARCHSSKQPEPAPGVDPGGCAGPEYLTCFKKYWAWTKTDAYKAEMRKIVAAPDFLEENYLSTELRVPSTLLRTNACSPIATNALANNIWDNFSSQTYKTMQPVGWITVHDPVTGEKKPFEVPGGGRGYTRPPSLVSAWSTAPFLQNNTLGPFTTDPSVDARMKIFQASIEQLLWPEKRQFDSVLGNKVPGTIDRTDMRSSIEIPTGYLPSWLAWVAGGKDNLEIGPIPKGTPISLVANIDLLPDNVGLGAKLVNDVKLLGLGVRALWSLWTADRDASDAELLEHYSGLKDPLLDVSKCPDLVVNRGHYFGTAELNTVEGLTEDEKYWGVEAPLSDDDKRALIEFVKTF